MNFILNNLPWFWIALTVIFIIIEIGTTALTTIWFAIGSFALIFISMLKFPFYVQILIFSLISLLLLFFTRPLVVKKIQVKKEATNADSLIGKKAVVTEKISEFDKGAIKINGLVWSATAEGKTLEPGSQCIIKEIRGVTTVVSPVQE